LGLVDVQFQPEKQATPVMEYPTDVIIGLGRGRCYGLCPSYSLSINGDGVVTYEGRGNVKVCGPQTGLISKALVAELVSLFEKADFFALRDYEAIHWNDSPYFGLSLTLNGKTHEITHYDGDVTSPVRLNILEDRIDEVTDSKRWVGDSVNEIYTDWCETYPTALPTP
jgi:hypothetical protein